MISSGRNLFAGDVPGEIILRAGGRALLSAGIEDCEAMQDVRCTIQKKMTDPCRERTKEDLCQTPQLNATMSASVM